MRRHGLTTLRRARTPTTTSAPISAKHAKEAEPRRVQRDIRELERRAVGDATAAAVPRRTPPTMDRRARDVERRELATPA